MPFKFRILHAILFGSLILILISDAQLLPEDEVKTLQVIFSKLGFNGSVTRSSCHSGYVFVNITDTEERNVSCNCPSTSTVCHVTGIILKRLNLRGVLPVEFGDLTQLQELDLTRNYISGSIPASFSQIAILKLLLLGNRLSGPIPTEIGNILSLQELVLEDNQLSGSLPESLGNLSNLTRLLLTANNFSGKIPNSFGKLKNLDDFRIDGNPITGQIPEFIGSWTKITRLDMQGTSLENPIPSSISLLENLMELRITDLKGSSIRLPDLTRMIRMERLVLRNCLIEDMIPDNYTQHMTGLKTLDLSFNMLTGPIPDTLETQLKNINYLFLTNNSLTGKVPIWIINSGRNIDLSYNNFTISSASSCQQAAVNLASSFSPAANDSKIPWCLKKDLKCEKPKYHSLFINCGGSSVQEYEEDLTKDGKSNFFSVQEKWGFSSTGIFMGKEDVPNIATNDELLNLNLTGPDFYKTARLAAVSLKYYGLCLIEGSYNVKLHFAEIMFSDDQTYRSLGNRIFDVYIQGNLVWKDFNVMEAAGGVGKGFIIEKNVYVHGTTLEIHLYWAGKGTTQIPDKGVHGPLISAIAVKANFGTGFSNGAIAGIVVGSCVLVVLIIAFLRFKGYLCWKDIEDNELRGLDLRTGYFSLRQIKAATGNFNPSNKIGEGGFGSVYKGVLSDGAVIAIKQLSSKSKQGNREFVTEIGMISALQHPNLVRLHGCCIEGNQLLLIYEYMENNSLARALFGHDDQRLNLDWPTRKKICLGIAKGLAYLHEESRLKIVHRDIKASNMLLDKDLNAKISDFGLAKLDEEENTHISTRIAGTIGYMAPEYAMRGYLTDKADVYSFGIVALEIVSGKSNTNCRPKEECVYLLDWAYVLQEQGKILDLVDPILDSKNSTEEVLRMLNIALLCTNPSPTLRPSMSSVVSMLEGNILVQAPIMKLNTSQQPDARFKAFEKLTQESQTFTSASSQESRVLQNSMSIEGPSTSLQESRVLQKSMSIEGPWVDSSISIPSKGEVLDYSSSSKLLKDLYDVNLD